jgi:hypothetical protein
MARFTIPVLVYEGDYATALVITSLLEVEGIPVSFDGAFPIRPSHSRLYVAARTWAKRGD